MEHITTCPWCNTMYRIGTITTFDGRNICPKCKRVYEPVSKPEPEISKPYKVVKFKDIDLPISFTKYSIKMFRNILSKFYDSNWEEINKLGGIKERKTLLVFIDYLKKIGYDIKNNMEYHNGKYIEVPFDELDILIRLKTICRKQEEKTWVRIGSPVLKEEHKKIIVPRENRVKIINKKCSLVTCKHISGNCCGVNPIRSKSKNGKIISCDRFSEKDKTYKFKNKADALIEFSDIRD